MSATLTTFQTKLIKELTKEFERLNPPTPKTEGKPRFSIATIENSINEKARFIVTARKYNVTMAEMLKKTIEGELKVFAKEFGKYLTISNGTISDGNGEFLPYTTIEYLVSKASDPDNTQYARLVIKSKSEKRTSKETVNVWFKTVNDSITLQNGDIVNMRRIIGLIYSNGDYHSIDRDWTVKADSLESFIQNNPNIHKNLTNLCVI